ncbi:GNAT family N-acetyltransferase [Ruegeria halocynthiae]|uniref:GNAT family N-acetyltransferase n=1 Tax=Ruegeria halocynthiae TaxID=985054 RepID=UPI000566D62D|nr:GNAT family N-acetyltransferase [Ruegeria halocynthiae]
MIEIEEIFELSEKRRWMKKFLSSYKGESVAMNEEMFGSNVRFFVACEDGKQLGFIRINDKSAFFERYTSEPVWNAADAYVKTAYRSKGVMGALLRHVVANCNVKMTHIETARLASNEEYYRQLGFTYHYPVKDGRLSWAFVEGIKETVIEMNQQGN